jgi:Na+-transporting NADH:ubiquinone oxidoreductase subunit C
MQCAPTGGSKLADQSTQPKGKKKAPSDKEILFFIIVMCFLCGFLLAVVAYTLEKPQTEAKEFDQNKQMLIAAKILTHKNTFIIIDEQGEVRPALFNEQTNTLEEIKEEQGKIPQATDEQLKTISKLRIRPLLTDDKGELYTLESKQVNLPQYLSENKKSGYAKLPLKLLYAILPNDEEAEKITAEEVAKDLSKASTFVLPISGFGLWAPIYGYLAIDHDGDTVIGTTWYDMAETPGLGANITEEKWQRQFYGKLVFQESPDGKSDFKTSPLGIIVVKGKVQDVYGTAPKSKSAVDGMSGATLTGDGVTNAYTNSLTPYRAFLIKVHEAGEKGAKKS